LQVANHVVFVGKKDAPMGGIFWSLRDEIGECNLADLGIFVA